MQLLKKINIIVIILLITLIHSGCLKKIALKKEDDGKELVLFAVVNNRAGDTAEALDLNRFTFNEDGDLEVDIIYDTCEERVISAGEEDVEDGCKKSEHLIISKEKYDQMLRPKII